MAQIFNPDQFMESAIQGANDTKVIPCPTGDWHGRVDSVKAAANEIKKGDRAGDVLAKLNVFWEVLDDEPKRVTGREKVMTRQEIVLDLTDEGLLDMGKGKNVKLGKLREAIGQNDPTVPFSPRNLVGALATINVGHRPDPSDPSIVYDEVKAVRHS